MKKAKIRNRYNQIKCLTQDTIWESDKNIRKHNIQESQQVSFFPACKDQTRQYDRQLETQTAKMSTKGASPWNGQ